MGRITKPCPDCGKVSDLISEIDLGSQILQSFECGHIRFEEKLVNVTQDIEEGIEESLFDKLLNEKPTFCEVHQRNCIKSLSSRSGKHLFPYQRDGVIAAIKNNAKFIFADEMGLGKTIQGLVTIAANPDKLLPAIFVCKSIAKTNWLWETMDVLKDSKGNPIPAQVITSSSNTPFDIFKIHIISFDMMNRLDKLFKFSDMKPQVYCKVCSYRTELGKYEYCPSCTGIKFGIGDKKVETYFENGRQITKVINTQVSEQEIEKEKFRLVEYVEFSGESASARDRNKVEWTKIIKRCKTIILDEVHLLKNPESQRSKALKAVCSLIPHKLMMSGTLIKNNASEYFVPLNIVKPEKYWRQASFCYNNVRYEAVRSVTGKWVNKYTGLISPKNFFESVKDVMIRRSTDDVLPELPTLWKQQKYFEMESEFQELYDESEKNFAKWFDNASDIEIRTNILAELAKLRHQTSLSKVDFTIDLALSFIMETEAKKIAIFTHHIDSREFLIDRMIGFFAKLDEERKTQNYKNMVKVLTQGKDVQEEIQEFKDDPSSRIIILSTLSHGESINLQFMSDSILHERQWNPANEDQAISGRFRRIGHESNHIICQIPVAIGTIDEYFVELVERKRNVAAEIDTNEVSDVNDSDFVRELAEKIAAKGRAKWRL